MPNPVLDPEDVSTLQYLVTHVFCPLRLPDGDDHSISNDHSLAAAVTSVAKLYTSHTTKTNIDVWRIISQMLNHLCTAIHFQCSSAQITSQLATMGSGGKFSRFPSLPRIHALQTSLRS